MLLIDLIEISILLSYEKQTRLCFDNDFGNNELFLDCLVCLSTFVILYYHERFITHTLQSHHPQ